MIFTKHGRVPVARIIVLFSVSFLFLITAAVGIGVLGPCEVVLAEDVDAGLKRRAKRTKKKIDKHRKEVEDIVEDLEELIEELEDDEDFDDDGVIDDLEEAADAGANASEKLEEVSRDLRRIERGQVTEEGTGGGGFMEGFTNFFQQIGNGLTAVGRFFRSVLFLDRLFGQKQVAFVTAAGTSGSSSALRSVESYDFMVIARENVEFFRSVRGVTPDVIRLVEAYYEAYYKFCAEFGPLGHCDLDKDGDLTTLYERRTGQNP